MEWAFVVVLVALGYLVALGAAVALLAVLGRVAVAAWANRRAREPDDAPE